MQAKTHILFSLICVLFYIDYYNVQNPIIFTILVLFTTLAVDIDESNSKLGKHFKPFSSIIQWILGHRGLLHSLLIPLLFYIILSFLNQQEIAVAIVIGYISHIAMDILTPQGVYIFYPFKLKINGPIKVGSWLEKLLAILLLIAIAVKLLFVL